MRGSTAKRREGVPADAVVRARKLRREAPEAELHLWRALRNGLLEWRFRRQVPLGRYVTDFCSHRACLVVEVDGDTHAMTRDYDAARTRFITGEGHRVIRFSNDDVLSNIDGVISFIAAEVEQKTRGAAHD